ncbi:MAG: hypothetical protein ACKO5K_10275 [Armatimonadota bacterium]
MTRLIAGSDAGISTQARRLRLNWLAEDDPERWRLEIRRLCTLPAERSFVGAYATIATQSGETARGTVVMEELLRATNEEDFTVLLDAGFLFSQANNAQRAADLLLKARAKIPDTPPFNSEGFRKELDAEILRLRTR